MEKSKKIGVMALAKVHGIVLGALGLLAGILYSFGGFVIDILVSIGWVSSAAASTPGLSYGTILAFGALIGMPVIFGVAGFVAGAIVAVLFNIISKLKGGFDINLAE